MNNFFLNSVINFESLQAPCCRRYPKTVIVNNMFLTDFITKNVLRLFTV